MKTKLDISGLANKLALSVRRHSPEILTVGGILAGVGGAVLACTATVKAVPVVEGHKGAAEKIRQEHAGDEDKRDAGKALTKEWVRTGADIVVLYGPAVALGVLSATSIMAGNRILRQRNVALAAAYTALDQSFRGYRNRVIDRYGEDVDTELYYDLHREVIEETVTDENGSTTTVKTEALTSNNGLPSPYARWFAYGEAKGAEQNLDYNEFFLQGQEQAVNVMFRAKEFMFVNDILKELGYPLTVDGQSNGWIYDRKGDGSGSRYISFNKKKVWRKDELNPQGGEWVWMIDLQPDGPILERAVKKGLLTA